MSPFYLRIYVAKTCHCYSMPVYNLSRLFSFAFRHVILLSIYQKNIIKAIKTIVKIKLKKQYLKIKERH